MSRKAREITKVGLHQALPALKETIFKKTRCNLIPHLPKEALLISHHNFMYNESYVVFRPCYSDVEQT
jgi:hypothetical protein